MCKITLKESEVKEEDYNFIVSGIILSQGGKFKYNDIMDILKSMFTSIPKGLELALQQSLIRLRDNGFLNLLGSVYQVIPVKL